MKFLSAISALELRFGQEQYKQLSGHLQIMQEGNSDWIASAITGYAVKTHCFSGKYMGWKSLTTS